MSESFHKQLRPWKTRAQTCVGGLLVFLLAIKLLLQAFPLPIGPLRDLTSTPVLEIIARFLEYSAGVELAYMLCTPGPDEAIDPIIMGLAAAILLEASHSPLTETQVVVILSLCLAIGLLFVLRARYIPKDD